MAGQSPWQERDTACHSACSVRKQRELDAAPQLSSVCTWSRTPEHGLGLPTLQAGLPPQSIPSRKLITDIFRGLPLR